MYKFMCKETCASCVAWWATRTTKPLSRAHDVEAIDDTIIDAISSTKRPDATTSTDAAVNDATTVDGSGVHDSVADGGSAHSTDDGGQLS